MTARQVFYEGHVQGVGYRYTVKQIAMGYEVRGWVKNLPDGRVEMLVLGEEEELAAFLEDIRDSVLGGHIRNETVAEIVAPEGVTGFAIVR
jgi:acylphosphatase